MHVAHACYYDLATAFVPIISSSYLPILDLMNQSHDPLDNILAFRPLSKHEMPKTCNGPATHAVSDTVCQQDFIYIVEHLAESGGGLS